MHPLQEMGRYATVVIDPPWPLRLAAQYEKRNSGGVPAKKLSYPSMSLQEIADLPVGEILAEDSLVFCWSVNQFVFQVPALFDRWGVEPRFLMVWHKSNGMQIPNGPKYNGEFVVVGIRGKPRYTDIKAFWTVNSWPRGAHSEKPEEFYALLRRVTAGPRLDIFSRRLIDGFDGWGDEVVGRGGSGDDPPW